MGVSGASNDLGLMGNLKIGIDKETGKMRASSDVFSEAVEEMYEAKRGKAVEKEDQIKLINKKLEALSNLQAKVTDLANKSNFLFHSDAWGNYGVFSNMYANFSSTSVTPVTDMMNINLASNTHLQEFTFEIEQLAHYDSTTATTGLADSTSDLNWNGNLTINGQVINVTTNMSLTDVRNAINSKADVTNVNANIVKVGTSDYRLSLQATQLGTPITISEAITGDIAGHIPSASGKTLSDLSAKFKFNNIPMTRSTNDVDDIVSGLTLSLKKAEVGTTITVQVTPDQESTKRAINDWVQSLNQTVDEVKKHQSYDLDSKKLNEEAILNDANIVSEVNRVLKSTLGSVVSGVGNNDFRLLDQIGIKMNYETGKLVVDEQILDEKLKTNFAGVRKAFEYQNQISNGSFMVSEHPSSVPSSIIADNNGAQLTSTVTINKDAGGNVTASVTINGGIYAGQTFTVPNSAISITGDVVEFNGADAVSGPASATPYKDFTFVYVGLSNIANSSSDTTTVRFTQGFADRLGSNLNQLLETQKGEFVEQKKTFTDKIKSIETAIADINERAKKEKERYQKDFARLEAVRQMLAPLQSMAEAFANMMGKK